MDTTEFVLIVILSVLLSILLILTITVVVFVVKMVNSARRVVAKAEDVIDSVEAATDVIRNVSGPMGALKVIKNIIDLVQKRK